MSRAKWFLLVVSTVAFGQTHVNPDAQIVANFEKGIQDYVKLHQQIKSKLPLKPTSASAQITEHQDDFSAQLRAARVSAKQGDLFTLPIAAEIRRLIMQSMQGSRAHRVHQTLRGAEPVHLQLRVNDVYPKNVPLQSMPGTLLANLPRLPNDLQYRLVGRDLVLLDVDANMILDIVPNAMP